MSTTQMIAMISTSSTCKLRSAPLEGYPISHVHLNRGLTLFTITRILNVLVHTHTIQVYEGPTILGSDIWLDGADRAVTDEPILSQPLPKLSMKDSRWATPLMDQAFTISLEVLVFTLEGDIGELGVTGEVELVELIPHLPPTQPRC